MSNPNNGTKDLVPEALRALANSVSALVPRVAPALQELSKRFEPLTRTFAAVAPFAEAVARGVERWDTADNLLNRGWVPNHTTPFDLIVECGDDDARLDEELLAYYEDNWSAVRERLERQLASYDVDDEAKATFREALDAHEAGYYRSVTRVLFPEFERLFRVVVFGGRAGQVAYTKLVKDLSGEAENLKLGDFLISGFQDIVMFRYLTEGVRERGELVDESRNAAPEFAPGLAVGVDENNVAQARRSPVPTRHAVAHGLVAYSTAQSSLNALFIGDHVFSVVSRALRQTSDGDAGDGRPKGSAAGYGVRTDLEVASERPVAHPARTPISSHSN